MTKAEQERFDKMWDALMEIKTASAVGSEQNKRIIEKIGILERRQTLHEELNSVRHKENTQILDSLKTYQDKQTWSKKLWDRIFTGTIAVVSAGITWFIAIHFK